MDVNQFLDTFIEESVELLDEAQNTLLNLDPEAVSAENINQLFRCMHTIKGSGAVFKLVPINNLAHTLETFLDTVRTNVRRLTKKDIEQLLLTIDCFRIMIAQAAQRTSLDEAASKKLIEFFKNRLLESDSEVIHLEENQKKSDSIAHGWKINFQTSKNMFQLGNDPARLLNFLENLGKLEVECNFQQLPDFDSLDPEQCYLGWNLKLTTNDTQENILEIFSWMTSEENVIVESFQDPLLATHSGSKEEKKLADNTSITSIRVKTEKIDSLINTVGELIITKSMLKEFGREMSNDNDSFYEKFNALEQCSRELQESAVRIRMVPIEFVFKRFQRMVHDIANNLKKEVQLIIEGEQTELDKNLIEKISDPLTHLIRNALDHGIETTECRKKSGKSVPATIQLRAYHEGGNIIIEVSDDGMGLDKKRIMEKAISLKIISENDDLTDDQIYQFIFEPGFSTRSVVSELSGRGVGLDVVKQNLKDLGGDISIDTVPGSGATFKLIIPLTLAIMDCQLVKVSDQTYIIPLISILKILKIDPDLISRVDNKNSVYQYGNEYIPIIELDDYFQNREQTSDIKSNFLIIVEYKDQLYGLGVDELLSQQQIVIKNLDENYKKINSLTGVTILGDGSVALIIDVKTIITRNLNKPQQNYPEILLDQDTIMTSPLHFLVFRINGYEYGIDILNVKEILLNPKVTRLPNTPDAIKGIINVRGVIIPLIDLAKKFSIIRQSSESTNTVIILKLNFETKTQLIGILVDEVLDSYKTETENIEPLAENMHFEFKDYINGLVTVKENLVTLLKIKTLILSVISQEKTT